MTFRTLGQINKPFTSWFATPFFVLYSVRKYLTIFSVHYDT